MNQPAFLEKGFRRSIDALPEIFRFVEGFFTAEAIDRKHLNVVCFAVEEIFTNLVKYNPPNGHDILIRMEHLDRALAVSLTACDVDRFDPRERPEVDVTLPIERRRRGGLGIHLVKRLMDRIEYRYEDRTSTTTLFKNLEP